MDYLIGSRDEIITIEKETVNTEQRNRLLECYMVFQTEDGKNLSDKEKDVLKRIAYSLSEEEAKRRCDKIKEAQKRRLMAYKNVIDSFKNDKKDELQEIMDTVGDLVEAYDDYDFDSEQTVKINGNYFTFNSDSFDIEKHKKSLAKIGDESKGNTWRIEVDETGEVVLHW